MLVVDSHMVCGDAGFFSALALVNKRLYAVRNSEEMAETSFALLVGLCDSLSKLPLFICGIFALVLQ